MSIHLLPKLAIASIATVALASVPAAARAAAPVVHVTTSGDAVQVAGADGLRPGPLTLRLSVASPSAARTLGVLRLRLGARAEEVARIEPRTLADISRLEDRAELTSGATVRRGVGFRTTITAPAGTYLVVDYTDPSQAYATFEVGGEPRADVVPLPTRRLTIRDEGLVRPGRIDSTGRLTIVNEGDRAQRVTAVRIGPRVTTRAALRAARRGADLRTIGYGQDLIGLVSGATSNLVRYALKPGRWLLVSSYAMVPRGTDGLRAFVTAVTVR